MPLSICCWEIVYFIIDHVVNFCIIAGSSWFYLCIYIFVKTASIFYVVFLYWATFKIVSISTLSFIVLVLRGEGVAAPVRIPLDMYCLKISWIYWVFILIYAFRWSQTLLLTIKFQSCEIRVHCEWMLTVTVPKVTRHWTQLHSNTQSISTIILDSCLIGTNCWN